MEQKVSVWKTEEGRRIRNGIILVGVLAPIGLILGFYGMTLPYPEHLGTRIFSRRLIGSGIMCIIITIVYSWIKINNLKSSPLISVCCPYCSNTFQIPQQGKPSRGEIIIEKYVKAISFFKIPQQQKPFKVKCPNCAKESLFR